MIDLHTHTLLSDGELLPSELARRAEVAGYTVLGMTDHVDASNIETVTTALVLACEQINRTTALRVIPGVEITHVAPAEIPVLAKTARRLGARLVVVHGETIVEPVIEGTNRHALESDIDILAHPGILAEADAKLAAERSVAVEISARKGHSLGNGRTARLWHEYGFPVVLDTDAHSTGDLITDEFARRILRAAGIKEENLDEVFGYSRALADRLCHSRG